MHLLQRLDQPLLLLVPEFGLSKRLDPFPLEPAQQPLDGRVDVVAVPRLLFPGVHPGSRDEGVFDGLQEPGRIRLGIHPQDAPHEFLELFRTCLGLGDEGLVRLEWTKKGVEFRDRGEERLDSVDRLEPSEPEERGEGDGDLGLVVEVAIGM